MIWKIHSPYNQGTEGFPEWVDKKEKLFLINFQASFSYNFPIFKFHNNKMSLGPNVNAAIGYLNNPKEDSDISGIITLDFPEYIMFRYGHGATREAEEGYGFGIGIGYTREIIPIGLGTPIACIEVIFPGKFSVRLGTDLKSRYVYMNLASEGITPELSYHEYIVQLSRTF